MNYSGNVLTNCLIAFLAWFSVGALTTDTGARFHSLALGCMKLFSLSELFFINFILFWLDCLVFPWILWNSPVKLFPTWSAFQTSISLVSAAIWLIDSHPSLSSIFLMLTLSSFTVPHSSRSILLNTTLMPCISVGFGS